MKSGTDALSADDLDDLGITENMKTGPDDLGTAQNMKTGPDAFGTGENESWRGKYENGTGGSRHR
jgi:hypothetical protein